jgi:putative peptidoglycan lipid II flippase
MLLSPIFLAAAAVATSLLNAQGRFAASAVAPLVYNLAIIGAAVFLAPVLGVQGLALGVVAGALGHLAVQLRPLRATGFRYQPSVDLSDPDARQALVLMAPRALGLGASQLTFVVATSLASGLAVGSVSAFTFAFTAFQIPLGIIGIPMGVVTLPSMSRDLARGEIAGYVGLVTRSLRLILFVMLPIAALGMVLRVQGVRLLFDYGRFSLTGVELTAAALLVLLLALPSEALIAILARAFYAGRDTITPVIAAILAVIINVSFGIVAVTVLRLGLPGIALGIALGSWAEALLLLAVLDRRMPTFLPADVLKAFVPAALSSTIAGLVAFGVLEALEAAVGQDPAKPSVLLEILVAGGLGGLVYLAISLALRIPELATIVRLMSDALPRPGRP